MVVNEVLGGLLLTEFFQWICPKNVAHQTMSGGFAEAVNLDLVSGIPGKHHRIHTCFRSSKVCNSGLKPP
jgi:hypothetical protein